MKKLLVALLAITTASAFAGNTMIRLDGCFDGQCDNLDFSMGGDDTENAEDSSMNLALNYAYSFGAIGVGGTLVKKSKTTDGDIAVGQEANNAMTIGLSGYYNIHGKWDDSCFVALHYNMTTNEDNDTVDDSGSKVTDIVLEYGHRFMLGKLGGVAFNWAPSVSYTMTNTAPNADGADEVNSTALTINAVNFAMTY